ncbi:unnamed protein product [Calypogeia fissa]
MERSGGIEREPLKVKWSEVEGALYHRRATLLWCIEVCRGGGSQSIATQDSIPSVHVYEDRANLNNSS